ncbi:GDP-mannose 4,6-dehydratase [Pantoea sp. GbtcB22]|jgi:nucleoside-diphosphate-sugar epimerase|uniref:GDP-mannose 4,6-dehydratase n=1 Tax=Pantoea sp. GbtcB22 TaxID=2824767 RepID=UPI001C2F75D0|nr:GDP-mannose 4,6-dehydratase [Pantoea sp. GbtcB22]
MKAKKALITGINGFTGQYMAAELSAAGYSVYGIGASMANGRENYHQVDLADTENLASAIKAIAPDVVVHLAAIAFVGHANPNAFYKVNLEGTRNLLQALVDLPQRPESVLIASSANVYGNATAGQLREDTVPNPANDYAVSKLSMEYMARLFNDRLPIILARPFNYTGRGQAENFLIPKIVKHFRDRKAIIELGNIDVWRDFSDVRYLTACYLALLQSGTIGQTINVASGEMHSLRDVIALCEDITGHKITIQINPAFVRANEVKQLCGDTSLLKRMADPLPPKIPLKETLRWMLGDMP